MLPKRMPVLFVSHGAPTFALQPGLAGPLLGQAALQWPKPKTVLVVSPHWATSALHVSTCAQPQTLHDFADFELALNDLHYPAPGHPALAQRTLQRLSDAGWSVQADPIRGLDHGAWVPLRYLYPQADVPVFQVSLPRSTQAYGALQLGQALAPLRDEGVLIVGSGGLTHNLHEFKLHHEPAPAHVQAFATWVRAAVLSRDVERLAQALTLAPHASRAHPTPEHFWPLLVAAGASFSDDSVQVLAAGFTHAVLSMESFVWGVQAHGALPSNSREGHAEPLPDEKHTALAV
jgi:4,5-DOPA dioxygenase extradiol